MYPLGRAGGEEIAEVAAGDMVSGTEDCGDNLRVGWGGGAAGLAVSLGLGGGARHTRG